MSESSDDNPGVVIFPPLLFAFCVVGGLIAHFTCPYRLGLSPWVGRAFGAVAFGALALALWGQRTMRAAGTNIHPGMPALAIVERGPFRVTRNPLYLSLILLYIAIGVMLASPAFLLFAVPLIGVLHFGVVLREERYLNAKFGDVYRDYKARVRRWI
jgi:protein-S-isoprenylcysteine O-methyltransferase Ste14